MHMLCVGGNLRERIERGTCGRMLEEGCMVVDMGQYLQTDSCRDVIVFIASFVDITTRRTCMCMHAYSYIGGNFWFGSESHCYRLDV